jgi:hypothetical protein
MEPMLSYIECDFYKHKTAIEVQLGKYSYISYDFWKLKRFFDIGIIQVGVEILPTKHMQKEMSNGPGYYELAVSNLITIPDMYQVPIVILGIE